MTDRNRLDEMQARVDAVKPGVMRGFSAFTFDDVAHLLSELAARDATIAERTRELGEAREILAEVRIGRDTWKARAEAAELDRDGRKRAAESQNRQWSAKCTELTEMRARAEAAERRVAEVETTLRREREIAMTIRTCLASVRPSKARDALSVLRDGGVIDFGRENVDVARALESALEEIASVDVPEPAGGDDADHT